MLSRALVAVLAIFVIGGCNQTQAVQAIDRLKPCTGDDTPVDAYCGTLKVFENRATKQGRQIDLNIVVLPALQRRRAARPAVLPRRRARARAPPSSRKAVREMFRRVQTDRDIVLVDQRGTGKSNPLNCDRRRRFAEGAQRDRTSRRSIALKTCHGRLRRRPDALHHADRDGRSRRRPRAPRLRQDQHLRRLVRHARRRSSTCASTAIASASASSTAWRRPTCGCRSTSRATRSARSTLLAKTAPATTACNARPIPTWPSASATLIARLDEESADGQGHASAHRRDAATSDRRARCVANIIVGDALLADHVVADAGARRARRAERLPGHAGARGASATAAASPT